MRLLLVRSCVCARTDDGRMNALRHQFAFSLTQARLGFAPSLFPLRGRTDVTVRRGHYSGPALD